VGSRPVPEIPCVQPINLQTDLCGDENGKAVPADCYVRRIRGDSRFAKTAPLVCSLHRDPTPRFLGAPSSATNRFLLRRSSLLMVNIPPPLTAGAAGANDFVGQRDWTRAGRCPKRSHQRPAIWCEAAGYRNVRLELGRADRSRVLGKRCACHASRVHRAFYCPSVRISAASC
jgi:hypothetical protein